MFVKKFEYNVKWISRPDNTQIFDQMGEEGWELVGISGYNFVFKREKQREYEPVGMLNEDYQ